MIEDSRQPSGLGKNQNQRYEVLMHFRINGIHAIRHEPGYECLRTFPTSYRKSDSYILFYLRRIYLSSVLILVVRTVIFGIM